MRTHIVLIALTAAACSTSSGEAPGKSGKSKDVFAFQDPDVAGSPAAADAGVTPPPAVPDAAQPDVPKVSQDDPPDPDAACGYGVIVGLVCSPSQQVFVNGAEVSVDATDCEGQPLHVQTESDEQGGYTLTGVPSGMQMVHVQAGSYENSYTVLVEPGKTTDVTAMGKKACAQAIASCTTGSITGNVCPPGKVAGDGAGLQVYVLAKYCGTTPILAQTYTGPDGSFTLAGVPTGDQQLVVVTQSADVVEAVTVQTNTNANLGHLAVATCEVPDQGCQGDGCDKEKCDCIDSDGDGKVDEGCGFFWTLACTDGCNCIDDDKDGKVDEDCPSPQDCGAELCNCEDDDGDGKIDESCCNPGDQRFCDENVYCAWGRQTCQADGSWSLCQEIAASDIPQDCQPVGAIPGQDPTIYDKTCCVAAGFCCQDYPAWQSVGTCSAPCP